MRLSGYASARALCLTCMAAIAGTATIAKANTVNFDDLTNLTVVTNQYAAQDITFSSANGEVIYISTQPQYMSTPPNFICTGMGGSIDCMGTVIFNFATPVDDLMFDAVGDQNAIGTSFAQADIYQNGVLTVQNMNLLVSQGNYLPDHQDFSAYANITQVVIHDNTDPAGTGYDTITFTPVGSSSAPEPGTMWMFGIAGGAWAAMRWRLRRA